MTTLYFPLFKGCKKWRCRICEQHFGCCWSVSSEQAQRNLRVSSKYCWYFDHKMSLTVIYISWVGCWHWRMLLNYSSFLFTISPPSSSRAACSSFVSIFLLCWRAELWRFLTTFPGTSWITSTETPTPCSGTGDWLRFWNILAVRTLRRSSWPVQ